MKINCLKKIIHISLVLSIIGTSPTILAGENSSVNVNSPNIADPIDQSIANRIKNSSWRLVRWEVNDNAVKIVRYSYRSDITLAFSENSFGGDGGCNRYLAPYRLVGNSFSIETSDPSMFPDLASQSRGCNDVGDQESRYFDALRSANRVDFDSSGNLEMFYTAKNEKGVLYFERNPKDCKQ